MRKITFPLAVSGKSDHLHGPVSDNGFSSAVTFLQSGKWPKLLFRPFFFADRYMAALISRRCEKLRFPNILSVDMPYLFLRFSDIQMVLRHQDLRSFVINIEDAIISVINEQSKVKLVPENDFWDTWVFQFSATFILSLFSTCVSFGPGWLSSHDSSKLNYQSIIYWLRPSHRVSFRTDTDYWRQLAQWAARSESALWECTDIYQS